jgi:hypothetical protein
MYQAMTPKSVKATARDLEFLEVAMLSESLVDAREAQRHASPP